MRIVKIEMYLRFRIFKYHHFVLLYGTDMLRKNEKSSSTNIIFISIVSQNEKRILYEAVYIYNRVRMCVHACVRASCAFRIRFKFNEGVRALFAFSFYRDFSFLAIRVEIVKQFC